MYGMIGISLGKNFEEYEFDVSKTVFLKKKKRGFEQVFVQQYANLFESSFFHRYFSLLRIHVTMVTVQ